MKSRLTWVKIVDNAIGILVKLISLFLFWFISLLTYDFFIGLGPTVIEMTLVLSCMTILLAFGEILTVPVIIFLILFY